MSLKMTPINFFFVISSNSYSLNLGAVLTVQLDIKEMIASIMRFEGSKEAVMPSLTDSFRCECQPTPLQCRCSDGR